MKKLSQSVEQSDVHSLYSFDSGAEIGIGLAYAPFRNVNVSFYRSSNLEDYEALALKLAGDPALLQSTRRKLERNRSTCRLFDSDRFRRHIEAAYTTMWDIYRRGESPRSFRVEPSP